MSYCTKIQSIINEADKPDVIPHQAASHMSRCPECRSFADERTKLQELMAPSARVTVPVNFNVLLNEKLSRVKAQKSSWLSSTRLVRLGTATAGLAIALLAVQYSGLFFGTPENRAEQGTENPVFESPKTNPPGVVPRGGLPTYSTPLSPVVRQASTGGGARSNARAQRGSQPSGIPIFIVRDRDREVEVPMMPVSLGMQQQVLNSSGRQQPRSSDISY